MPVPVYGTGSQSTIAGTHRKDNAMTNENIELLYDIGLDALVGVFAELEAAEEVIVAAQTKYPDKEKELSDLFLALLPPKIFAGKRPRLYNAHCKELVERVANGVGDSKGIALATKAEVVALLSELSLAAPLKHDYVVLYETLFTEIFGDKVADKIFDYGIMRESYKGACDELLNKIRSKYERK